jgi:hypothetical protein
MSPVHAQVVVESARVIHPSQHLGPVAVAATVTHIATPALLENVIGVRLENAVGRAAGPLDDPAAVKAQMAMSHFVAPFDI